MNHIKVCDILSPKINAVVGFVFVFEFSPSNMFRNPSIKFNWDKLICKPTKETLDAKTG